jgi:signal peptidase II
MLEQPPTQPGRSWSSLVTIVVAIAVIALDQLAKWLVVQALAGGDSVSRIDVVAPWLGLVYVENRGAAFGLFQGSSDLVLLIAVALVVGIGVWFHRQGGASPLLPVATGLIVGGALGNIVDRIRFGYVIDFIAVGPWPKFNVADSAITVGVVLLFVVGLSGKDDVARRRSRRAEQLEAGQ